jgi:hypothetical protein
MAIYPEIVIENINEKSGKSIYSLNYDGLIPVAIKAIQEQQVIIEKQAEKINALERKFEELELQLKALQK